MYVMREKERTECEPECSFSCGRSESMAGDESEEAPGTPPCGCPAGECMCPRRELFDEDGGGGGIDAIPGPGGVARS